MELSSFQLDGIKDFKADIAILLNITPDHLDRYEYSFENYIQSKLQITNNQNENDVFIYNYDDTNIREKSNTKAKMIPFSLNKEFRSAKEDLIAAHEAVIASNSAAVSNKCPFNSSFTSTITAALLALSLISPASSSCLRASLIGVRETPK